MKKFTIKGVLDNFRTSVAQPQRVDQDIQETLKAEHFQVKRTFRHGFPYQPTAMAFDPVQKLLAIGSKCGSLRILGQPGVDVHVRHDMDGPPGSSAVLHLQFLINEGALVSATADDTLHLWNFRQKLPQVLQSLKFQKEKITCMHLPMTSKWLYVGTDRGNIHVVNIENFHLSGYIINWNKAIELSRKTHPGAVVHLSDNPIDSSKLLVGFETGQVVLWDLRTKQAEMRCQTTEALRSIAWHHEGKQFMCSHIDGTLTTWSVRQPTKPLHVSQPHAKPIRDDRCERYKPITKVDWKSSKTGEAYVIFAGGMPADQASKTPSITVVHSKTTTVLEMEHPVLDFITLCDSPYPSDLQDPFSIIALLQNDLVVMDLQCPGFPCLENPYPMDIHESAVTCCSYLADCPMDLIPAFYSVGRTAGTGGGGGGSGGRKVGAGGSGSAQMQQQQMMQQQQQMQQQGMNQGQMQQQNMQPVQQQILQSQVGYSTREWPISGGTWSANSCSYSEIILTGHADGSVKFWDASAGTLQVLYKLKTSKVFDRYSRHRSTEAGGTEEDPFAIQLITLCAESRKLGVAGASAHVILFTFRKTETCDDVTVLEVPIVYENPDEAQVSPDCQFAGAGSAGSSSRLDMSEQDNKKELLRVRTGVQKKPPGFQAQLVCLTPWNYGEPPSHITSLTINSNYGLMAYGNEVGIVIIDIEQKVCLLNVGSPDLYGAQDPYARAPRSPKRGGVLPPGAGGNNGGGGGGDGLAIGGEERQPRSPSIDQINGTCSSQQPSNQISARSSSNSGPNIPNLRDNNLQASSAAAGVTSGGGGQQPRRSRSQDKLDNSFSRSRSSSMSSLETIASEAIQCLAFADSYAKRNDTTLIPTLWVGTSLGSVLTILVTPPDADSRSSQPVVVSLVGVTIFRLKGSIMSLSFLDCTGALLPYTFESWRDDSKERLQRTPTKSSTSRMSPTTMGGGLENSRDVNVDRQYVVIASEKQARVVALPSQTCIYRQQLADVDFVVKAESITFKDSVCLMCYISNGHLAAYSLPSLRPLIDIDFLPLSELSFQTQSKTKGGIVDPMLSIWGQQLIINEDTDQISRTFCFSNKGHGLYLTSPSELQKYTLCIDFCSTLPEMFGELFLPLELPEPPKEGFFKGLFGSGVRTLDREELFGEASGKANKNLARHIPGPGMTDLNQRVMSSTSEINRAHKLMLERGEKLGQLEDRAERMNSEAEVFRGTAHDLMLKYKDKKWYQL